jgi:hypothetical protein
MSAFSRRMQVKGLFQLGPSFATDGNLITSDVTFLRLFPGWPASEVTVGIVVVHQVLYAEISTHLAQYATLKAMGYTHRFMLGVVAGASLILGLLGFLDQMNPIHPNTYHGKANH